MYYTNYLINNIPVLLSDATNVKECEAAGFLGMSFEYKGYNWEMSVDGHKVNLINRECGRRIGRLHKSIFTVGKKEETNKKHVEEIHKYMNVILVMSGRAAI